MAGQIRMEELLVKAVTIDDGSGQGSKCRRCQDKHSVRVARTRLRQESARTRLWGTSPLGMRRPSYVNHVKKWMKRLNARRRSWIRERKSCKSNFKEPVEFPDMSRSVVDEYKEKWQQEL